MSFFIKKEEGERVMCKCQNQKMKWIIAISDTCNDEINLKFLTARRMKQNNILWIASIMIYWKVVRHVVILQKVFTILNDM